MSKRINCSMFKKIEQIFESHKHNYQKFRPQNWQQHSFNQKKANLCISTKTFKIRGINLNLHRKIGTTASVLKMKYN